MIETKTQMVPPKPPGNSGILTADGDDIPSLAEEIKNLSEIQRKELAILLKSCII